MTTPLVLGLTGVDLSVVGGVLAFLIALGRKLWPIMRKVTHFVDDWFGEPGRNGVDERPGVMRQLQKLTEDSKRAETRLTAIEHELKPNSGKSLRDAVDRVEKSVTTDKED